MNHLARDSTLITEFRKQKENNATCTLSQTRPCESLQWDRVSRVRRRTTTTRKEDSGVVEDARLPRNLILAPVTSFIAWEIRPVRFSRFQPYGRHLAGEYVTWENSPRAMRYFAEAFLFGIHCLRERGRLAVTT